MVRQHRLGAQELGLSGHQTSQSPLTTCGGLSPLYTKGASLPRQIQPAKKVCLGGILPTNYDLIVIFLQNQSRRFPCGSGGWGIAPAFLWLSARIAPWPLPGDGLSHPEHGGPGRIPTGDRNGRPATGPLAGGLIHDRLGHHLMNGRRQPGEDAGGEIARMMV